MWEYTEKVKEHFFNPHNVGEIKNPSAKAEVGSLSCGDALYLTLKIDEKTNIIQDAKFMSFGCGSAIASSSILTDMIIGKTVDEAKKITNQDIADELGGLPRQKMHCSVMGYEALEKAIANYLGEQEPEEHTHDEGELICTCFQVTDATIARVVRENNITEVEDVTNFCKAVGGCGTCRTEVEDIIKQVQAEMALENQQENGSSATVANIPSPRLEKPKVLTNLQKIKLIEETIESDIRPGLMADGGNIELIDVVGNQILVKLQGACSSCPSASATIKHGVEARLKEIVGDDMFVEEVH